MIADSSDHTISGEFAAFNAEISVRRLVSRGGQATTTSTTAPSAAAATSPTCSSALRHRTGRSCSIIDGHDPAQIIEARPEDLRVYLEEAAGISKYKERRKETETRIRHTRENLDRLNDLREEIGEQLEHLKRQAKQAERYKALQEERRVKDAEWKALEYRGLDGKLQGLREALSQEETKLAAADRRTARSRTPAGNRPRAPRGSRRRPQQGAGRVYQVGSTLARIEQQIQHQRELADRLKKARDEAHNALQGLGQHISGDETRLNVLRESVADAEPQLEQRARRTCSARTRCARRRPHWPTGNSAGRPTAATPPRPRAPAMSNVRAWTTSTTSRWKSRAPPRSAGQ